MSRALRPYARSTGERTTGTMRSGPTMSRSSSSVSDVRPRHVRVRAERHRHLGRARRRAPGCPRRRPRAGRAGRTRRARRRARAPARNSRWSGSRPARRGARLLAGRRRGHRKEPDEACCRTPDSHHAPDAIGEWWAGPHPPRVNRLAAGRRGCQPRSRGVWTTASGLVRAARRCWRRSRSGRPGAGAESDDSLKGEQWAVAEGAVLEPSRRVGALPGRRRRGGGDRLRREARASGPGAQRVGQLRRGAGQRGRRRRQRLRRRRPRRRPHHQPSLRQDLSDGNGHGTHVAGIIAGGRQRARRRRRRVPRAADDRQGARRAGGGNHRRGRRGHPLRRRQRGADHQPEPRRADARPAAHGGASPRRRPPTS